MKGWLNGDDAGVTSSGRQYKSDDWLWKKAWQPTADILVNGTVKQ